MTKDLIYFERISKVYSSINTSRLQFHLHRWHESSEAYRFVVLDIISRWYRQGNQIPSSFHVRITKRELSTLRRLRYAIEIQIRLGSSVGMIALNKYTWLFTFDREIAARFW